MIVFNIVKLYLTSQSKSGFLGIFDLKIYSLYRPALSLTS